MSIFFKKIKEDYFLYALVVFLISFIILPTAKMVNNTYYLILALPALIFILKTRFVSFKIDYSIVLWLVLFLIFIVSGAFHSVGFQYYKHIFYLFLFLSACVFFIKGENFFSDNAYRFSFWVIILYVFLSAIYYWVTGKYGVGQRVVWLPSRMTGPIYTSMLISALFCICLPVWLKQRSYVEFFVAISISLFCMSFILQSRSGIVSLLFVAFVYFAYLLYLSKGLKYISLFFSLSIILFAFFYSFSDSIPILNKLISRADAGRFELWLQLLRDFNECSYLFGCGPDFSSERMIKGGSPILHSHNIFLALLVHTGILSLIVFLLICTWALYSSFVNKNYWGLYLLSSMVALNFDGSHIVGNPDELWVLILLPIFMIMLKNRKIKESI